MKDKELFDMYEKLLKPWSKRRKIICDEEVVDEYLEVLEFVIDRLNEEPRVKNDYICLLLLLSYNLKSEFT
ncbi:hypothetical protein [Pseudoneobacillus sp. C159]